MDVIYQNQKEISSPNKQNLHHLIMLYSLSDRQVQDKNIQHYIFVIDKKDVKEHYKFNIDLISPPENLQALQNIRILAPDPNILITDRIYLKQEEKGVTTLYEYWSDEINLSHDEIFLWHFEFKRNNNNLTYKEPRGDPVQKYEIKILGFLYSIFRLHQNYDALRYMIKVFLKQLKYDNIPKLPEHKISDFFNIMNHCSEICKLTKSDWIISLILIMGILPRISVKPYNYIYDMKKIINSPILCLNLEEILLIDIKDEEMIYFFIEGLVNLLLFKYLEDENNVLNFLFKCQNAKWGLLLINEIRKIEMRFNKVEKFFDGDEKKISLELLMVLIQSIDNIIKIFEIIEKYYKTKSFENPSIKKDKHDLDNQIQDMNDILSNDKIEPDSQCQHDQNLVQMLQKIFFNQRLDQSRVVDALDFLKRVEKSNLPFMIISLFIKFLIKYTRELDQLIEIYTFGGSRIFDQDQDLCRYYSDALRRQLINSRIKQFCLGFDQILTFNKSINENIFDELFEKQSASMLKQVIVKYTVNDYKTYFKKILFSEVIFPFGSIKTIKDLISAYEATHEDKVILITEMFIPQKHKISEKEFLDDLKFMISKLFLSRHGANAAIANTTSFLRNILLIEDLNIKPALINLFLCNFHESFGDKELFKLSNESVLAQNDEFCKEYIEYVSENIFGNYRPDAINEKNPEKEKQRIRELKRIEQEMKQAIQQLKPNKDCAISVKELKNKLIAKVFKLVDSDQVAKIAQSIIFEDPRSDHIWFTVLEIANSNPNFSQEIKSINAIVSAFYSILQDFTTNSVEFAQMRKLAQYDDAQRKILVDYLAYAQKCKDPKIKIEIKPIIQENLDLYKTYLRQYISCKTYIKNIVEITANGKPILLEYEKFKAESDKTQLKNFKIPAILKDHEELLLAFDSNNLSFCFRSIFINFVNETNKQPNSLTIQEYNDIINKSILKFQSLKEDFKIILKLPLTRLQGLFKNLNDIDLEMQTLLKLNMIEKNNLNILRNILKKLKNQEKLKDLCQNILAVFKLFKIPEGNITKDIISFITLITTDKEIRVDAYNSAIDKIEMIYKILENEILYNIIEELTLADKLADFVQNKTEDELKTMLDGLDEHGESLLRAQSIVELNVVRQYITKLNRTNEKAFLRDMQYLVIMQKKTFANIDKLINSCRNEIYAIQNLYHQLHSREEASKTKIIDFVNQSTISINYNKTYEILFYSLNKRGIPLQEMIDLRDRALLMINRQKNVDAIIHNSQENEDNIDKGGKGEILMINEVNDGNKDKEHNEYDQTEQYLKVFIEIVDTILIIENNLKELVDSGYPNKFIQNIKIEKGKNAQLMKFEDEISKILEKWEDTLKVCYEKYPILANFYAQQYWIIEDSFFLETDKKNKMHGLNILRFVNPIFKLEDLKDFTEKKGNIMLLEPEDRLQKLGDKLLKLYQKVGEPQEKQIVTPIIEKFSFPKGKILLAQTDEFHTLDLILAIYARCNDNLYYPKASQILFCSQNTTWQNIRSFIYLLFSNQKGSIYCLVNADKLPFKLKALLTQLFKELYMAHNIPNFRLAIIYTETDSSIYTHFSQYAISFNMKANHYLNFKETSDLLLKWGVNSIVVTSKHCGYGKSNYIQTKVEELKYKYIPFTIAGNSDLLCYIERLCANEELINQNHLALHLDIGIVNDISIINEFLFMITCLKTCKVQNYSFICESNTMIYIEIANTWSDILQKSLTFTKYLKKKHIEKIDLESTLNPGKSLIDPLQITCNFLRMFNDKTIDLQEIDFEEMLNVQIMNSKECASLIQKYFIDRHDINRIPYITYSQIKTFCKLLASQMMNLSAKKYLNLQNVKFIFEEAKNIIAKSFRSMLIELLIGSSDEYTTISVFSSYTAQNKSIYELNDPNNENQIKEEMQKVIENSVISWENSNHLTFTFENAGMFYAIYKNFQEIPENLRAILLSQHHLIVKAMLSNANAFDQILNQKDLKMFNDVEIIRDYQTMTHADLLYLLESMSGTTFSYGADNDRLTDYVLTPDNFLKICLMINRMKADIPVIIMGETGCGKSSLVKFLASNVLKQNFISFNLHAGITEEFFLEKIREYISLAECLTIVDEIWLFLDEFNTCSSIGLINEMICKKTLLGQQLPANLKLIAACNPYKIQTNKIDVGLVQQKTTTRLLHRVYPLPNSMMDYIWDYGYLQQKEEKRYIINMLAKLDMKENYTILFTDIISDVQQYIRSVEDASSVSLRDINRFKQVFSWFNKNLRNRPKPKFSPSQRKWSYWKNQSVDLNNLDEVLKRSLVLALNHCYIYRLGNKNHRKEISLICINKIQKLWFMNEDVFKEICNDEQEDYLCRMNLPKGIALNSALKENIFTALVCVLNKIPCFICGKPGCSKTLSVQLLASNLRGTDSDEPFFKTLPEIYNITYQGSESSNSEGIEKAFQKAHSVLANSSQNKSILPLILFDEMGLAELSPNNPLKVLHSLLEPDKSEVAFIGISNYRLDASKMNRVVFLARAEPDVIDLELTAKSIHESYTDLGIHVELMKNLAKAYFEYKAHTNSKSSAEKDFHGNRDFYSLIKQVTQDIQKLEEQSPEKILEVVRLGFERNFGGKPKSAERIKRIFKDIENVINFPMDVIHPLKLIQHNLEDKTGRYLMVISKGDIASYIINKHFEKLIQNQITIIGSKFPEDLNQDEYSFRVLSEIIIYMEKGWTLVIQGLDKIYGCLFDLFNQNFSFIGKRKNCRIALGSVSNPMCGVHDDFRCIVLVDESELKVMEPPFLNRFEKYVLNFESIMNKRQIDLAHKLDEWVKNLTTPIDNKMHQLPMQYLFGNYDKDSAFSLIFNHDLDDQIQNPDELLKICKKSLIKTATTFQLIYAQNSKMQKHDIDELRFFNESYFDVNRSKSLLEALCSRIFGNKDLKNSIKLAIYTFDDILLNLSDQLATIQGTYLEINIGELSSEKNLTKLIRKFYVSKYELLILRLELAEHLKHLALINFLINKLANNFNKQDRSTKHFVIIVHMGLNHIGNPNIEPKDNLSYLSEWEQITIDTLAYTPLQELNQILNLSSKDIIQKEYVLKIDKPSLIEIIEESWLKFKYQRNIQEREYMQFQDDVQNLEEIIRYHERMVTYLKKLPDNDSFWNSLTIKVLEYFKSMPIQDWKIQLFASQELILRHSLPINALRYWVKQQIGQPITVILYYLEENSAFESYFTPFSESSNLKMHRTIWNKVFMDYKVNDQMKLQKIKQSISISHIDGLVFPFSLREYKYLLINELSDQNKIDGLRAIFCEIQENEQAINFLDLELESDKKVYNELESINTAKFQQALDYCQDKTSYKAEENFDIFNIIMKEQFLYKNYLADVVKINLKIKLKKDLSELFPKLIMNIINKMITRPDLLIIETYYLLFKFEDLFSKLLDLIVVCSKLTGDLSLEILVDKLHSPLPIKYSKLSKQEGCTLYLLDIIFESVKLTNKSINDAGGFDIFLTNLQNILVIMESIDINYRMAPTCCGKFQFWKGLLSESNFVKNQDFSSQIFTMINSIIQKYPDYLTNEKVLQEILDHIDKIYQKEDCDQNQYNRFKVTLYDPYLKKGYGHKILFQEIKKNPEILRYAGSLINTILDGFVITIDMAFIQERNNVLKSLEETIEGMGVNSGLSALITEICYQSFLNENEENMDDRVENLNKASEQFSHVAINIKNILMNANYAQKEEILYPNLYIVVGAAYLKYILQKYSEILSDQNQAHNRILGIFSDFLEDESPLAATFRLFVTKCISSKLGSLLKTQGLLMELDKTRGWALKVNFGNFESILDISPFPLLAKDKYDKVLIIITKLLKSSMTDEDLLNQFTKLLDEASKCSMTKLCILQAITNKIYFLYANREFAQAENMMSNFKNWIIVNENKFLDALEGDNITLDFIKLYVSNFNGYDELAINENSDIKILQKRCAQFFLINIILAFNKTKNPFGSLFYSKGKLHQKISELFEDHYIIGMPESSDIDYLVDLTALNYRPYSDDDIARSTWNANLGLALYRCSKTCGYFYTVGGCTRVLENRELKCPAGHLIGGIQYNNPHPRPGDTLQEKEHKKYYGGEKEALMEVINHKRLSAAKGYQHRLVDSNQYGPRGLKASSFRCLEWMMHEVLYLFYTLRKIDINELNKIIKPKEGQNAQDYLNQVRKHNWERLEKIFEKTESSNLYIILCGILSEMCALFIDKEYDPKQSQFRDKFEQDFDQRIMMNMTENLLAQVNHYKKEFAENANKNMLSEIPLIMETFEEKILNEKAYPLQRLFRKTKRINWNQFKVDYLLNGNVAKTKNAFIDLYFKYEQDLEALSITNSFIHLTNGALNHYNHKITRKDAMNTIKIQNFLEECHSYAKSFTAFKIGWNKYLYKDLQLGCKIYKKQKIDETCPIGLILVDSKKENNSGILMLAGMNYLSTIQNNLIVYAQNISLTNKNLGFLTHMDTQKYCFQNLRDEDIIKCIPKKSLENYAQWFHYFNYEYGKGEEVYYDYDKIESILAREVLLGKRLIDDRESSISKIQYQFELLNIQGESSNLISEVKKVMPQKALDPSLEKKFNEEFDSYLKRTKNSNRGIEIIKEIFSTVSSLLCLARNTYRKEQETLEEFCSIIHSAKICNAMKGNKLFMSLKMYNLVGVYELIEDRLFDYILQIVPDFFKDRFNPEQKAKINIFLDSLKGKEMPTIKDMEIFIKRFIIRCLDADLAPDGKLYDYLGREDFWPDNVTNEMIELLSMNFPQDLQISHSVEGFLNEILQRTVIPMKKEEKIMEEIKMIQAPGGQINNIGMMKVSHAMKKDEKARNKR